LLGANLEPVILQWSALPRIQALGRLAASWAPLSHATWLRRESSVIIDGRLPVRASGITLNYDGSEIDFADTATSLDDLLGFTKRKFGDYVPQTYY
jgi:hypothetical protein